MTGRAQARPMTGRTQGGGRRSSSFAVGPSSPSSSCSWSSPRCSVRTSSWHPTNLEILAKQTAINAILAIGMTFVILTGGIDLSVGSVVGLTAMIAGLLINQGLEASALGVIVYPHTWMVLVISLAAGRWSAPSTAGSSPASTSPRSSPPWACCTWREALPGCSTTATRSPTSSAGRSWATPATPSWAPDPCSGISWAIWIMIGFAVVAWFVTTRTPFGREVYAVGGNERSAELSGVRVKRTKMLVYMISGFCAAIVGLIISSQLVAAHPATGTFFELNAIAAVVLGGTSLAGGRGTHRGHDHRRLRHRRPHRGPQPARRVVLLAAGHQGPGDRARRHRRSAAAARRTAPRPAAAGRADHPRRRAAAGGRATGHVKGGPDLRTVRHIHLTAPATFGGAHAYQETWPQGRDRRRGHRRTDRQHRHGGGRPEQLAGSTGGKWCCGREGHDLRDRAARGEPVLRRHAADRGGQGRVAGLHHHPSGPRRRRQQADRAVRELHRPGRQGDHPRQRRRRRHRRRRPEGEGCRHPHLPGRPRDHAGRRGRRADRLQQLPGRHDPRPSSSSS